MSGTTAICAIPYYLLTLLQLVPVVQMAVVEPDNGCLWQCLQTGSTEARMYQHRLP